MKSVRQTERIKPSVLYCPEVHEEDMVNSFLIQNVTSEMENTMMIYKTVKLLRNSNTNICWGEEGNRHS
jgi:hypothetical protein